MPKKRGNIEPRFTHYFTLGMLYGSLNITILVINKCNFITYGPICLISLIKN
jgi:hypothetical protein